MIPTSMQWRKLKVVKIKTCLCGSSSTIVPVLDSVCVVLICNEKFECATLISCRYCSSQCASVFGLTNVQCDIPFSCVLTGVGCGVPTVPWLLCVFVAHPPLIIPLGTFQKWRCCCVVTHNTRTHSQCHTGLGRSLVSCCARCCVGR
jgi:hypothetical protein